MRGIRPSSFAAAAALLFGASLLLTAAAANVHFSWAQAPDYESPAPAYGQLSGRLVVIEIDGLRRDHAFDPELMPNLCRLKGEGAGGAMLTTEMVMTGICVRTMWTGVSPDILAILKNWDTGTVEADSFFRQADKANLSVAMLGDDSLTNQFGVWADFVHGEADGGIKNINASDDRTWALGQPLLNDSSYDVVVLHLAGLDHAGHTYTLDSEEYRAKCRWLDRLINETAAALDPNSDTLAVLVDHAQTDAGYHGFGEWEPRDVAYVLWGKGVLAGGEADIDQKDVAPTLCALMGIPMPSQSEGIPRTEVLDATWRERASISLYAARLRCDYVDVYAESTGSGISPDRFALAEAEAAFASGDWNATEAAARQTIADTNDAYYASLSPNAVSLAPVVAASAVAIVCAASLLWAPPSRSVWVVLALGLLLVAIGAGEVAFGAVDKSVVQSPAWRWGAGLASLLLCAGALAASLAGGAGKAVVAATLAHPRAVLLWLAVVSVAEIALLAGYSSLLDALYDKPFLLKLAIGAAAAVAGAFLCVMAFRSLAKVPSPARGPLPALLASAAGLALSCLFVKHLVVVAAIAVGTSAAWLAWRTLRPSPSGTSAAKLQTAVALPALAFLLLLCIMNIGTVVWGDADITELDYYPRPLVWASVALSLGLLAWYASSKGARLAMSFGGPLGIVAVSLAFVTALVFHHIPDGEFALLDWTARISMLFSVVAFALSLSSREREPLMIASAVSLYLLLATPGQSLVFTLLLASCLFLFKRSAGLLGRGVAGHLAKGLAVVALSYVAFTALGYGFNFTSVDIRASTIGQTELVLPWAFVVIGVKYNVPALLALWAFTDTADEALGAAVAAMGFLCARVVQIAMVLFTNVEQFTLIVPFTGELLHILLFTPGIAAFGAFLAIQRREREARRGNPPPEPSPATVA